jgi:hypothetical protein
MQQSGMQSESVTSAARAGFAGRPPSQSWEQVPLADAPQSFVWIWAKPFQLPQGLIVRVPDETWRTAAQSLTMRTLLHSAGVDPTDVLMWQLYGLTYQALNGTSPLLDQAIPLPVPGVDPSITVYVGLPQFRPMQPLVPPAFAEDQKLSDLFDRIDVEWNTVLEIESNLERLRKALVDMSGRLKGLNRDLSPDERLYSNNQDKQDWLDARRWLRDADNRMRSCVKDYDIGDTSLAGQRKWVDQIHQQFIVPRLRFDGMEQALNTFEFYRKMVMTLQTKMNNAYLNSQQNAERRAQQVLSRIATKVREAQTKRTALGVVLDG